MDKKTKQNNIKHNHNKCFISFFIKEILFLILIIIVFFLGLCWVYFEGEPLLTQKLIDRLSKLTQTTIQYKNYSFQWLFKRAYFYDVEFKTESESASINECQIELGLPDFYNKKIPIKKLKLIEPRWKIKKIIDSYQYFPDFFSQLRRKRSHNKWKMKLEKIILQDFEIIFEDLQYTPAFTKAFKGNRFIINLNRNFEEKCFKANFVEPFGQQSQVSFQLKLDSRRFGTNFKIDLAGKNIDFTTLEPYLYEFTKIKIKEGKGSFDFDLENKLGNLKGYLYFNIENFKMESFSESIFSSLLGLSRQSFLNILKKNNNKLELDFFIYGSNNKPTIKMGHFSEGYFLEVPLSVAKDSVILVDKVLNTLLLGIPRKILDSKKDNQNQYSSDNDFE